MRTRSRGAVSPPPSAIPLTAQRKRDSGICMNDESKDNEQDLPMMDDTTALSHNNSSKNPVTPRKRVKRVRFSDPGPAVDSPDPLSTGLTPHIKRIALSPRQTRNSPHGRPSRRRRQSLPASLSCPLNSSAIEVQFTPLRQTLDSRVKRRLRRSHLSEELNDIESVWRESERARQELSKLREESQHKEDTIRQLMLEVESQRQLGIQVNQEEEERVQGLQNELDNLRQAVEQKQGEVDSFSAGTETDYGTSVDFTEAHSSDFGSPSEEMFPGSPCRFLDSLEPIPPNIADAATQASVADQQAQRRFEIHEEEMRCLKQESSDAKAALELVKDELQSLGFASSTAGIEDVLSSINDVFRRARLDLEYLLPGETTTGFQNNTLLPALVEHIRVLLRRNEDAEAALGRQELSETVLRGQFNKTLERIDDLEKKRAALASLLDRKETLIRDLRLAAAAREAVMAGKDASIVDLEQLIESKNDQLSTDVKRIGELDDEASELKTKTARLQAALDSYRREITSLESLVVRMEEDKDKELAHFQKKLQEALATQAQNIELTTKQQRFMEEVVNSA